MSSMGRFGSNQRPAFIVSPMASRKPSSTLYWPISNCLVLPGGWMKVLLLLSVATPMSVRPTWVTPGTRFIRSTMVSLCGISWARAISSTWRMLSRL